MNSGTCVEIQHEIFCILKMTLVQHKLLVADHLIKGKACFAGLQPTNFNLISCLGRINVAVFTDLVISAPKSCA